MVFLPRGNERSHYYIKRVVGIPGDKVTINNGTLYINDSVSDLIERRIEDPGMAAGGITLGQGEYFVMGDNPDSGEDSRSDNLGPVAQELIVGKAWFALGEKSGFTGKKK